MGVISRGFKNAFRNNVRTSSIVLILAISIAMALIMLESLRTVQSKIDSVKGSIGNFITVSPAGIRGFEGGGELLTEADVNSLSAISGVKQVVKTVSDRVTPGTDISLQSAVEPGSFGNRQHNRDDINGGTPPPEMDINARSGSGDTGSARKFSMPVTITGTSDLLVTSSLNVSKFDVTSGAKFNENSTDNVAMVGTALATKNNLSVGSIFQAYDKDIAVVGIFDGGNEFANAGLVMPIKSLQVISGQADQISSVTVEATSIDTVATVESDIKTVLGSKADVASQQDSSQNAVKPLENIKAISLYSLIGSLVAGAIIIFLTMVMIVRERRREIGVLKAIGASNVLVVSQFTVESLVLTLISSFVGIILGMALSNPVLNVLVNNSESSASSVPANFAGGRGPAMMRFGANLGSGAQNALRDLHMVVGWDILFYGLLAAILIAILGSAIPAFFISKVSPAEVLRSE